MKLRRGSGEQAAVKLDREKPLLVLRNLEALPQMLFHQRERERGR